ncbi:MAG: hypothetical protein ABEJ08_03890 [Halobacteriaceae archaeon]
MSVFLLVVLLPLIVVGAAVPLGGPLTFVVTHSGLDSPVLYGRFLFLTATYGGTVFAPVLALSVVAGSTRRGLALGLVFVVVLVVGLDLAVVAGLATGVVPRQSLSWLLAVSPGSSYRGLVLQVVVDPVATVPVRAATPLSNAAALAGWWLASLSIAAWRLWPRDRAGEAL